MIYPNKKFRYIISTGRTGSKFLQTCFKENVNAWHTNLTKRVKNKTVEKYIKTNIGEEDVFIECNPAFSERYSLSYDLSSQEILNDLNKLIDAKCLFITRNPINYVASIKASNWSWKFQNFEYFESQLNMKKDKFNKCDNIRKAAHMWKLKNKLYDPLLNNDRCMHVNFEDVFKSDKEKYVGIMKEIYEFFDIDSYFSEEKILKEKNVKHNIHNKKQVKLSQKEKNIVNEICFPYANKFGY